VNHACLEGVLIARDCHLPSARPVKVSVSFATARVNLVVKVGVRIGTRSNLISWDTQSSRSFIVKQRLHDHRDLFSLLGNVFSHQCFSGWTVLNHLEWQLPSGRHLLFLTLSHEAFRGLVFLIPLYSAEPLIRTWSNRCLLIHIHHLSVLTCKHHIFIGILQQLLAVLEVAHAFFITVPLRSLFLRANRSSHTRHACSPPSNNSRVSILKHMIVLWCSHLCRFCRRVSKCRIISVSKWSSSSKRECLLVDLLFVHVVLECCQLDQPECILAFPVNFICSSIASIVFFVLDELLEVLLLGKHCVQQELW